eukprot:tig00020918_g15882.t1
MQISFALCPLNLKPAVPARFEVLERHRTPIECAAKKKQNKPAAAKKPISTVKLGPEDRGRLLQHEEVDGKLNVSVVVPAKLSKFLMDSLLAEASRKASAPPGFRRAAMPNMALTAYKKFVLEKAVQQSMLDVVSNDLKDYICDEEFTIEQSSDEMLKIFEAGKDFEFQAILSLQEMEEATS